MKRFWLTVWCLFAAATLAAKVTTFDNFEYRGRPLLLPDVQKYQPAEGAFKLPGKFTVAFPKGEDIVLEQLADELKRFPGVTAVAAEGSDAVCRFVLTEKDVPEHKESYTLRIDDKGVTVSARTTAGLFYGAQTLRGMIRNVAKPEFPKCFITDWPDLDMRSFTFNISRMPSSKMPLLKRTLDILAGLKVNTLFIGISSAFPYKNNPLTLRKNAFTEAEMRDLAEFCRRRHFELIPMMQIFSHSAWMMNHPDWPRMREDRAKPRSYSHSSQWCPLNGQAWQVAEELVAQQIAFFKPRYFYPVFDEICLCPFHECEDCVKQDPRKLLSDTLRRVEGMIVKHGATPLYCHDNFFSRSIWPYGDWYRTQLKPGTIIRYWKYEDDIPEEQLNALKDFKLLGNAVWGKPFNVYNLAHAIKRHNGIGCGMVYFYFGNNAGFFANYMLETPDSLGGIINSAGYLWKLDDTLPYDLTYDGTLDMMRRLAPEKVTLPPRGKTASPVPLEKVANSELSASSRFPHFASDGDLAELKKALAALPERFRLMTAPGGKYYGLRLAGRGQGRGGIAIGLGNRKAEMLSFLLTASCPDNGMEYFSARVYGSKRFAFPSVARLTVNYADKTSVKIPLRYRFEINDWNRPFGGANMRFVCRGVDADRNYYSFGVYDFRNPHPDKPITDVLFTTNRIDNISPVILALSAWNLERPFAKFTEIDPAQVAKRPGVPDEAPPAIKVDLDFANGMGPLQINAPSKLKKALKYEIVDDPTSPAKGKVLKITVPPGDYQGREGDHGYARITLEMPYRVKKSVQSLVVDLKVETAGTGYRFGNVYLRAADMSVKDAGFQAYYLGKGPNNQWERKFFAVNQRGNMEQRMKKASQARFYRLSFFLEKKIDAPIEIRVGNIGTSTDCIAPAPLWKEGGEAEPL